MGSDGVTYPPGAVAGTDIPTLVAQAITNPGAWVSTTAFSLNKPSWVQTGASFDGSSWPGSESAAVTAGWRRIKQESAPSPHGPIHVRFDFTDPALPKSQIRMPWVGPDVVAMMTDPTYWFATTSEPGSLPTPAH